jgi:large subunit ribosomal protein L10
MLPTERNNQSVEHIRRLIERCTIVISADFTGMSVGAMTELRRALRGRGVEFLVVKNRLAYLAADAAGKPVMKEIVHGPTGLALGFGEPVEPAKALTDFVRSTKYPLKVIGGVLGERILTAEEVIGLAALPGKDQLVARLAGQLLGPATGLVYVLSAPVSGLARVLQRRVESMDGEGQAGPGLMEEAPDPGSEDGVETNSGEDKA